jgi:hypothetical protein
VRSFFLFGADVGRLRPASSPTTPGCTASKCAATSGLDVRAWRQKMQGERETSIKRTPSDARQSENRWLLWRRRRLRAGAGGGSATVGNPWPVVIHPRSMARHRQLGAMETRRLLLRGSRGTPGLEGRTGSAPGNASPPDISAIQPSRLAVERTGAGRSAWNELFDIGCWIVALSFAAGMNRRNAAWLKACTFRVAAVAGQSRPGLTGIPTSTQQGGIAPISSTGKPEGSRAAVAIAKAGQRSHRHAGSDRDFRTGS